MPITDFVETAIEVAASRDGHHFLETTAWVSETHPHLAITQSLATGSGNFVITHVESGLCCLLRIQQPRGNETVL